jgi:hypothetical protein
MLVLCSLIAACGRPANISAPRVPQALAAAQSTEKVTPEQALIKATAKARAWHPDARLVGTAWVVAKLELGSIVFHLFQSPSADSLFEVRTKLVSFWQDTAEVTDLKFTRPARLLETLVPTPTDAKRALEIAKTYLPANQQKPVATLIQARPTRFVPSLWGVQADQVLCLINAETGKVLAQTSIKLPALPFGADSPFPAD